MKRLKNLTVTVDEAVAKWARVWAARHNTSVSRMLGEMLTERMQEEEGYQKAMRRFLSVQPIRLKEAGRYPAREELHDRDSLR